jgi:hypothetical protein
MDSSFKRPFVFNFEFNHFSQILDSKSHWESIYTGNNSEVCFHSSSKFIPGSKVFENVTNLMLQMDLKISMEKACSVMYSFKSRHEMDPSSTFYGIREIVHSNDIKIQYPDLDIHESTTQSVISELHMKLPFPLNTPRKAIQVETLRISSNKVSLLNRPFTGDFQMKDDVDFSKKIKFNYYPDSSGKEIEVEGYVVPQLEYLQLEKIDNETTRMSQILGIFFIQL